MKVLVESYGEQRRGIRSAQTGENLWALSLARALAKAGHQVHTIGYSEGRPWRKDPDGNFVDVRFLDDGTYKLLGTRKGEPLTNVDSGVVFWDRKELPACMDSGPFDVLFHQTVERDRWDASRFGKVLIGSFSERIGHYDSPSFQKKENEVFVFPTRRLVRATKTIGGRFLPVPVGTVGDGGFARKRLAWTAKRAYRPEYGEPYRDAFARWAEVVCRLSEEGYDVRVLAADSHSAPFFPGVDVTMECEQEDFQSALSGCSVALPMNFAGALPDCALLGVLPVLYRDGGIGYVDDADLQALSKGTTVHDVSEESLFERARGLLTDEGLYREEYGIFASSMAPYTDSAAASAFQEAAR